MSQAAAPGPDWGSVWPAPAKLNLCLRILGRRPDGYHDLQMAIQFLDRCDELVFTPLDDGRIRRLEGLAGVPEEQDLAVRAARLLQSSTGCQRGTEIQIRKCIPVGGGLGGGSSDAATTLCALNRLWRLDLSVDALLELGRQLGADVPVFVLGRAAWVEGIGERLTPVDFCQPHYLVVSPGCSVSTSEVFQAPGLTRNSAPITIARFLSDGGDNDCTNLVRTVYPAVGRALDWLDGFGDARLTGTGACIYAAFEDLHTARGALDKLPGGWSAFIARGCNLSPLRAFAGADDVARAAGPEGCGRTDELANGV